MAVSAARRLRAAIRGCQGQKRLRWRKITVLEKSAFRAPEQVLCDNLIEILTVFCNKVYGTRSYSNKKIINV